MPWADAFFSGMDSEVGRRRQSRLDALQADMRRSELALQQAAARREEERLRMQQEEATSRRERQDYLDRSRNLGRETAPFAKLLGAFPEADASPYTGRAYELDETFARDPAAAGQRMADPANDAVRAAGYEPVGPEAPTQGQERQASIQEAYRRFGGAANARLEAMAELRKRLAGMRGGAGMKPYSRDLEQEQRALDRMNEQISRAEQGWILGPDGQWQNINAILDPKIKQQHLESIKRLKAEYASRRQRLDQAYQERLGSSVVGFDPQDFYRTRIAQGIPEEQILQDLATMGYDFEE